MLKFNIHWRVVHPVSLYEEFLSHIVRFVEKYSTDRVSRALFQREIDRKEKDPFLNRLKWFRNGFRPIRKGFHLFVLCLWRGWKIQKNRPKYFHFNISEMLKWKTGAVAKRFSFACPCGMFRGFMAWNSRCVFQVQRTYFLFGATSKTDFLSECMQAISFLEAIFTQKNTRKHFQEKETLRVLKKMMLFLLCLICFFQILVF